MFDMILYVLVGVVAGIAVIVVFAGPEARAFLKAKARRRPILTIHRTDRRRELKVVDGVYPGGWRVKGYGDFETVREGIDITKSNIQIADAYDNVGTTIRGDHVTYAAKLKEDGTKDFDDAERKWKGGKGKKLDKKVGHKTIDWQSLRDFLPTYFNPAFIFALIEHRVSSRLPHKEPWSVQKIMAVGMVIFIIFIGAVILFETDILGSLGGGGTTPTPTPSPPITP